MKSTIKTKSLKSKPKYPCVKIQKDNRMVVLFIASTKGVCLNEGKTVGYKVGYYSESWVASESSVWDDFAGEITITV